MARFTMGVDEAGRGPLAGPVAVGIVLAPSFFDIATNFPGVADSKVLSPRKREELFLLLENFTRIGVLRFTVVFASAQTIDTKGISNAVRSSVYKGVRALAPDQVDHQVLLDGLLRAPAEYEQRTIVDGDASEPIISLASIAAKVKRDRHMRQLAKRFPGYGFEVHKGYGTPQHYAAIKRLGLCAPHRKTFNIKLMEKVRA